jgi:branched-chain amino acid transport system permease protein
MCATFPGLNTLAPLDFFRICFAWLLALPDVGSCCRARVSVSPCRARQNEARVRAVGIDPYKVRLVAFVISGMITALAGALYADLNRFVSPSMLSWQTSGEIMVFVILGGVGAAFRAARRCGAVHPAGTLARRASASTGNLLLGILLLVLVLFARGGLVGLVAGRKAA